MLMFEFCELRKIKPYLCFPAKDIVIMKTSVFLVVKMQKMNSYYIIDNLPAYYRGSEVVVYSFILEYTYQVYLWLFIYI